MFWQSKKEPASTDSPLALILFIFVLVFVLTGCGPVQDPDPNNPYLPPCYDGVVRHFHNCNPNK